MEKDRIFFAESGLTTTSANYIANLAKEAYKSLEAILDNIQFYTKEIALLGCETKQSLKEGIEESQLSEIEPGLMAIAQYKSLIAWLREAIKAKERLIKEAQNMSVAEACLALDIVPPATPTPYDRMSEDDVIASWGIKQRNRYYYLDTVCATIGSYIHPHGHFSEERDNLLRFQTERNTVVENGRDTIIYTMTPTVGVDALNNSFFALQKKYRNYQAELNSMKHEIEVALQNDEREKSLKEQEERNLYVDTMSKINAEVKIYKNEIITKAQSLKIVIPDSLKAVYDTLNKKKED